MRRHGNLLLVGQKNDPHLKEVAALADDSGFQPLIFDTYSGTDRLSFHFGGKHETTLQVGGHESVPGSEIAGVWLRQKPMIVQPTWSPTKQAAALFCQDEWRFALRRLDQALPNATWMNPLTSQAHIASKASQLDLAQLCGLRVPRTVVTNDWREVLALFETCDEVIYKCLYWASFPDQTSVLTTRITADLVMANKDAIAKCPGIFQEFIPKAFEYRVTLVGDEIFTARVNTPSEGLASTDWRHAHLDDIFVADKLDSDVEEKLRQFQTMAELKYGAYDLVVSKDETVYFLECNPAGQYLWLKNKCGLDISPAVVSFFTKECAVRLG